MKNLYEILVPTHFNNGQEIDVNHHKKWDEYVQSLTNGLTIQKTSKGSWFSSDKELFKETMIPVKIICTEDQINKIADHTAFYYEQKAIMFYLVSPNVQIINYDKNFKRTN